MSIPTPAARPSFSRVLKGLGLYALAAVAAASGAYGWRSYRVHDAIAKIDRAREAELAGNGVEALDLYRRVKDTASCAVATEAARVRVECLETLQAESQKLREKLLAATGAGDVESVATFGKRLAAIPEFKVQNQEDIRAGEEAQSYEATAMRLLADAAAAAESTNWRGALSLWQRVQKEYPKSSAAFVAESRSWHVARMLAAATTEFERGKQAFEQGDLGVAGDTFERIATTYADTEWGPQAKDILTQVQTRRQAEEEARAEAERQRKEEEKARLQEEERARRAAEAERAHVRASELAERRKHPVDLIGIAVVDRPGLGVAVRANTASTKGLTVLRVVPGSPADNAGIVANQVILRVGTEPMGSAADLDRACRQAGMGAIVSVILKDQGADVTREVRLAPAPVFGASQGREVTLDPTDLPLLDNDVTPVACLVRFENRLAGFEDATRSVRVLFTGPSGEAVGKPAASTRHPFPSADEYVTVEFGVVFDKAGGIWKSGTWKITVLLDEVPIKTVALCRIDTGPWAMCSSCGGTGRCSACRGSASAKCARCRGSGHVDGPGVCRSCDGQGKLRCATCQGQGTWRCDICGGSGKAPLNILGISLPCPSCKGAGQKTCNKCQGTGTSACSTCGGTGRTTTGGSQSCTACGGQGNISCAACGQSGTCQKCSGTGLRRVR